VNLDSRAHAIVRVRPRPNAEVNRYFICDHGRTTYRDFNRGDRIEAPLVAQTGELVAVDWDHALARAAQIVKEASGKAVVLASPASSNEALHLTMRVLAGFEVTGAFRVERVDEEIPLPGVQNLALRGERAPNVKGATLLGFEEAFDSAVEAIDGASLVVVLGDSLAGVSREALGRAGNAIYLGTTLPDAARAAQVVLPVASVVEEDGTFVNRDGRAQRYLQATWWAMGALLAELEDGDPPATADEAFDRLAREVPVFGGLSYQRLGLGGALVETTPAEVRS
jgi:NADH-quinone oxidoreductase subunit G